MPEPLAEESRKQFLDRCMADDEARRDFPDPRQRYAFCNSQWNRRDRMAGVNVVEKMELRIKERRKDVGASGSTLNGGRHGVKIGPMTKMLLVGSQLKIKAEPGKSGKRPFVATVTYAGKPSDHPVGGTEEIEGGPYKVMIPQVLLEAKIGELVGKAVFASEDLAGHAHSVKVGQFTDAWTEARVLPGSKETVTAARASGFLDDRRYKQLVDRIVAEARNDQMGFSYDLKDVKFEVAVVDGEPVLELTDFVWRGATALRREAAAYELTQLAAQLVSKKKEEELDTMDENELKSLLAEFQTDLAEKVIKPFTEELTAQIEKVSSRLHELEARIEKLGESHDECPPPRAEASTATEGTEVIPLETFAASIGQKLQEANQPLLEAMRKVSEKLDQMSQERHGERKTTSGMQLDFISQKYPELLEKSGLKCADDLTSTHLHELQKIVAASDNMTRDEQVRLLSVIGAMRRQLARDEARGGKNHE